eukprot:5799-Heterococcus_DN1.PRE.1
MGVSLVMVITGTCNTHTCTGYTRRAMPLQKRSSVQTMMRCERADYDHIVAHSGMNFSAYVANTSANTSAQAVSQPGTATTAASATSAASADRASKHKPLLGDAKIATNGKPNGSSSSIQASAGKAKAVDSNREANEDRKGNGDTAAITASVYMGYFRACGASTVVTAVAVSVASQIISVSKEAVLARWSGASSNAVSDGTTAAATMDAASYLAVATIVHVTTREALLINANMTLATTVPLAYLYRITNNRYAAVCLFTAGMNIVKFFIICWMGLRGSKVLHAQLLDSVVGTHLRFFQTKCAHCLAQLMAHLFTEWDCDTLDMTIPTSLSSFADAFLTMLTAVAVVAAATPAFVVCVPPVAYLYYRTQQYNVGLSHMQHALSNKGVSHYRIASVPLKRLDTACKSPLLSHFSQTLDGLP